MKIIVTITNCATNQSYDIQVDNRQKIQTTLRVLRENIPHILAGTDEPIRIQSDRNKRRINPGQTYEEAYIYSGDKLLVNSRKGSHSYEH